MSGDGSEPPEEPDEPDEAPGEETAGESEPDAETAGEQSVDSAAEGEVAPSAVETGETRRLDPLSIPYRAVTRALSPSTIVILVTVVGSGSVDLQSASFLALVLGTLALSGGYQYVYFLRFEYALTGNTFDVSSGVLSRRSREIPLGRVQNVDVGQNPVQRALGIAALRIETAGGGDTEAVLEYLDEDVAEGLRDDLRRAARRAREGDAEVVAGESTDRTAEESDREEVFALSTRSLVVLSLFSFDAGAGAISTFAGAILSGGDPSNLVGVRQALEDLPLSPVETAIIGIAAVAVLAWLLSVVFTFARYYGFRLVRVDEGLEYERGLAQRASGTIPVEKVQTVSLRESLAHRRLGYAAVAVETAGYSPGSDRSARQLAVPLAPRDEALEVARSVEPFDDERLDLERPPKRARRRYVARFSLAVLALTGVGAVALRLLAGGGIGPGLAIDQLVLAVPAGAILLTPVAAHLRWRNRGHRAETEHFVARTGFWRRVTRVVPYYRVQTVVDARTVFQRRRDLANVTADTASSASLLGGDAVAIDVDDRTADDLRERLRTELDRAIRERVQRQREQESGDDEPDATEGTVESTDGDPTDAAGDGTQSGDTE